MDAQVTKDNTWLSAIDGLSMAYYAIASVVIAIFIKALVNTFGNLDFCRNAEDATSPSVETPKTETPAEAPITNGDATADELAKPVNDGEKKPEENVAAAAEVPAAAKAEEPAKQPTTPAPAAEPVAELAKEPVVESAPSPVNETKAGESQQVEEPPKPVENPVVEETKEVRSEEVPPPLPTSNPPSPVTVFAESTKADAIPADQVPVPELSQPVVESVPLPITPEPSVVESVPQATSSPVAVTDPVPLIETNKIVTENLVSSPVKDVVIPSNEAIESVVPLPTEPEEEQPPNSDNIEPVESNIELPTSEPPAILEAEPAPVPVIESVPADVVPEPEIASPTLPEPVEPKTVEDTTEPTIEPAIDNLPEPVSVASEPVVHATDSLPDVSTESLPSLPEPVSESLPEPMSLPPVDSVPEPIANDVVIPPTSEPESAVDQTSIPSPLSEIPPPNNLPILTNGTTNGLPSSPNSNDVCLPAKEELKQIPDVGKDIRQEDGDKPVEAVGGSTVARVEE